MDKSVVRDIAEVSRATALIDAVSSSSRTAAAADAARVARMIELQDLYRQEGELTLGGERAGRIEAEMAVHELALALMLPTATVERELSRGRRVRGVLPSVWSAWASGIVTTHKVVLIDETVRRLQHDDSKARLDEEVVAVATTRTPGQLKRWLDRFVARVEAEEYAARCRKASTERAVWITPADDGMAWLNAYLPATDAAQIDNRLEDAARTAGADDPRPHDQRRADTLTDLLLSPGDGATDVPPPTTIGVVVPVQALVGDTDTPGELADRSALVPADVLRERAVQPGTLFHRVLTDRSGRLLDATELGRFPSERLGFGVRMRDGTSVFPTSSVPATHCDLDHTNARCTDRQCTDPGHGPTTPPPTSAPSTGAPTA